MANSPEHIGWKWLGRVSDTVTLVAVVGGLVVSTAIGIWAYVKELPGPEVAVLGLLSWFAVLGIIAVLLYIADRPQRKATLELAAAPPTQPTSVPGKPKLDVRFSPSAPYTHSDGQYTHYRIGVYNPGPTTIDHVRMELLSITPPPKAGTFSADFPYPVRRTTDPKPKRGERINADGKPLNPYAEESFEPLWFWLSSGGQVRVDGLDTKPVQWDGNFEMLEHESWCLRYLVSSGQTAPQLAIFFVRREGERVVMEQIPS
jgi:hypothetical protein